jgi:hypothetical protein
MGEIEAKCPTCGADLTEQVEMAVADWSEGLPESVLVWCDGCQDDIEFQIEVKTSNIKRARLTGPTPQPVLDAVAVIVEYLKAGGWEQAIIDQGGGVAFRLTNIYRDWMESLSDDEDEMKDEIQAR